MHYNPIYFSCGHKGSALIEGEPVMDVENVRYLFETQIICPACLDAEQMIIPAGSGDIVAKVYFPLLHRGVEHLSIGVDELAKGNDKEIHLSNAMALVVKLYQSTAKKAEEVRYSCIHWEYEDQLPESITTPSSFMGCQRMSRVILGVRMYPYRNQGGNKHYLTMNLNGEIE